MFQGVYCWSISVSRVKAVRGRLHAGECHLGTHAMRLARSAVFGYLLTLVLALIPESRLALASSPPVFPDLPLSAQAAISSVLGRDDPRYHHTHGAHGGTEFSNSRHRLTAHFTSAGVQFQADLATWELRFKGVGYGPPLASPHTVAPTAQANRVEYRRGAVTEWYINGPRGLQQGFTLTAPPPRSRTTAPLTLAFALSGSLKAHASRNTLALSRADGQSVLTYRDLAAWDSTGRVLPTRLQLRGSTLALLVEDAGAKYPVVVDPFVEQAKLTSSDGRWGDFFGSSIAISGDTVVVGASNADIGSNSEQGAAYIFVKPGTGWAGTLTESAKLTASDGMRIAYFGSSIAISGDTVVVGAYGTTVGGIWLRGAAYVFVKPGSGWAGALTENAKLTASDARDNDWFGASVAINGDTVFVGAPYSDGRDWAEGAAYVFVKPGSGWATTSTFNAKLIASDGALVDGFGASIAISGDTVVAGAPGDYGGSLGRGAAYIFVKPGTGWAGVLTESAKRTASDGASGDVFSTSVAINGDTLIVGAPGANIGAHVNQGAAYVFVKPGSGWAGALTENAKLTASDGAQNDDFGTSVAISGDTLIVGAPYAAIGGPGFDEGAAYVFVKPGSGWAGALTENAKLTASDGATYDFFGSSVATNGDTVFVGARYGGNRDPGAVYVLGGPSLFNLTLITTGTGSGTVTTSGCGLSWTGTTGTCTVSSGTPITLSASAAAGSTFAGYSDDPDCTDGSVTMNADKTCTATFTLAPVSLPDLTEIWNSASQSCRKGTCTLKGAVQVVNQGNATAPPSRLRVVLSEDATLDGSDLVVKESSIKKLKPGRATTSKVKVKLPAGVSAAGKYLFAIIDALGSVAELDETNNTPMTGPVP